MKQKLLHNLKFIILGVLLAAGLTFAYADGWVAPTAAAPAGNIDVPLHDGPTQVKDGGLSVGVFAVGQDAQFAQSTYLTGMVLGGTPGLVNSEVSIGGVDAEGTNHTIPVTVAGDVDATGAISNDIVKNANNSNLCAGTDGTIGLCTVTQGGTSAGLTLSGTTNGSGGVVATLSGPMLAPLTATIAVQLSHAVATDCSISTTPVVLGTVTIPFFSTTSSTSLPLPIGDCPIADFIFTIPNYSPTTTTTGEPIVAQ